MNLYVFSSNDLATDDKYKLKNKIKVHRVENNLTQEELGELINVTRQTIAVIEQGRQSPSLTIAIKIACAFRLKLEELFYFEEEE